MSASVLPSMEMAALNERLPSLICETDVEKQLGNIEKWLAPYFPINAIGLSIYGNETKPENVYAINIQENIRRDVEKILAENDADGSDRTTAGLMLFAINNGVVTVSRPADSVGASDFNGLAISLKYQGAAFGTLFLVTDKDAMANFFSDEIRLRWLRSIFSSLLYNSYCHHQYQEKTRLFNLYETVSSALCYAGDLQELLTTIISIVVSELPSEGGSILLFDDQTHELEFFSVMGDTEDSLFQCRFPADKGIAGQALQEGVPVIVSDVKASPNFFSDFDKNSGFVTKSVLAAPVTAGGEKVGVIEAINKVGANSFDESDKRVIMAIADEVGLAIKNARMFDYVVDSYCKIRQGLMSCKGCVRPLKSWTPCARQLDVF